MSALAAALLALQLAAVRWFGRGGATARWLPIARYPRWITKSWIVFAGPPVLGLLLLGRLGTVLRRPDEFAPLAVALPHFDGPDLVLLAEGAAVGLAIGTLAIVVLTRWRRSRRPVGQIGDLSLVLPRTRAELLPAALLSVTAGISEELAFRLFVPLLIALLTGSAWAGFAVATLLFGAMHRYQGWAGVLATTAAGALFAWLYLATGRLWVAMLFHAAIDLNGIVVRPALTGVWRR